MFAAIDSSDPEHRPVVEALRGWDGDLVVSPFTAAEADHLILRRLGVDAELLFLRDLARSFILEALASPEIEAATELCARYRDLELGLADASMVVLAQRRRTRSLATFDQRHFRAVTPLQGGSFELLPID